MWYLFTPEIYFLFAGLVFFLLSITKETDSKRDYYIALMVSSLGVVVGLGSLKLEGSLFFGAYRVDLFSQVFKALLAMGFFLVVTICDDLEGIREGSHPEFYLFMTTCTVGMMMLVSAVELITIYVALELSSYSLYILVPLRKGDQVDLEAAIKYLIIGATSSALLLFGMSYIYGLTHTTYLAQIFHILPQLMGEPAAAAGFLLLLAGFFFKLAIFPFHFWAPDVYYGSANQVTTYIATASKVGAIAILIRMVSLATGADSAYLVDILVTLSIVSMTLGNLVAIIQKDLKRMLAYSSIAHAGYVLIGILSMSREGYASAMFYALAYLIMNFSCFMVLTKVADGGKNLKIRELAGLHKRSPLLALTLMLGLFGLAGIPPTVGFTGKFLLFTAAMEQGYFALVVIGMINATISLYYYLIVVKAAYLLEPQYELPRVELRCGSRILSYFLILAMVVAGMFPARLFDMALEAAKLLII